jgi:serine phosphatase RsbU (regulator of sigma subunit)
MIYPNIERTTFISAIIAKIESKTGAIQLARAGHTPLIYCNGDNTEPEIITSKGIGIGLDSGTKFDSILEEINLELLGNGTIILYTDGVTEARNNDGEEYGEERLIELLKGCKTKTAKEIKDQLIDSVVNFCDETPLHDDLTFIVLKNEI